MRFPRELASALALTLLACASARASQTMAVPDAPGVVRLGDADPAMPIHLAFDLAPREPGALERLVNEQSIPGSPHYRRFLSNADWDARFAPDNATVAALLRTLRADGFTVERVAANAGVIDAVAPASVVARVFSTRMEMVAQPGAGSRFRHATPAVLPPELEGRVSAVVGLGNLRVPHAGPLLASAPAHATAVAPENGPDGGYGPPVLAQGFDYPARHGFDGRGRTAGILIAGDFQDSDVSAYLRYFRIRQTGRIDRVEVDGGNPDISEVEATLDVETVSGLAPGADIVVYEFPDFVAKDVNDAINQVVADGRVDAFSGSFGACETIAKAMGLWDPRQLHLFFLQAEAKGITPIFATGDSGDVATGCDFGSHSVSSPASDPNVVAVGGSQFAEFAAGTLRGQAGWVGSGGGVSKLFRRPAYQAGLAGALGGGRNLPDLALPGAAEDSLYDRRLLAQTAGWTTVGGTSWAAPAFGALLVEAAQLQGGRFGFVNPALYRAGERDARAFTDILRGNNGNGDRGYSAGPGFDLVTGLGVPDGFALARSLE